MSLWEWTAKLPFSRTQLLISVAIVLFGVLASLVLRAVIVKRLQGRIERLKDVDSFDAVVTQSPFDDPNAVARRQATTNLRSRYSVINRLAMGLGVAVTLVVATFPLLSAMPQAIVSLLVAIAAAVLGIAAKPFVENLISGVVISFSSQLRIGDTIIMDEQHYGTVEDITITHTVIKLWDWRRQIVPNAVMLQKDFTNLSHKDSFLWCYIEFHVDYEADLKLVETIATSAAEASEYNAKFEPAQMWMRELEAGTIKLWVVAWATSPDAAWFLRSDMRWGIAEGFRKHGIRSQLQHLGLGEARVQPLGAASSSSGRVLDNPTG